MTTEACLREKAGGWLRFQPSEALKNGGHVAFVAQLQNWGKKSEEIIWRKYILKNDTSDKLPTHNVFNNFQVRYVQGKKRKAKYETALRD